MIKGLTKDNEADLPETFETSEGTFELWRVDVDVDDDGKAFESPRDIDIKGYPEKTLVRAMFPITEDTHGKFIQTIEGSSTSAKRENFDVNLTNETDRYKITFLEPVEEGDDHIGFLMFNAKIQQLKNILFHRRIDWVYVSHVY